MKVLHLMNSDYKFNRAMVTFYSDHIRAHEHEICVMNGARPTILDSEINSSVAFTYFPAMDMKSRYNLIQKMKHYDIIVCHSIILRITMMAHIMIFERKLLDKLVWIEYGADLYQKYKNTLQDIIRDIVNRQYVKNIKVSIMIFRPDEKIFRARYGNKPITFYAPYTSGVRNPILDLDYNKTSIAHKVKNNQPIIIQVGHSATPMVRHIDTLNRLDRFKNENIAIRLPMSYGSKENAQAIINYAKSIFGDKVQVVTEFVPLTDYHKSLAEIDIGIWETHRQIALGNINPLIYLNKKIYLSTDSVMYDYFRENNVDIHDANNIDNLSFSEFIQDVSDDNGNEYRAGMYNVKTAVKRWENIYEWLEKNR